MHGLREERRFLRCPQEFHQLPVRDTRVLPAGDHHLLRSILFLIFQPLKQQIIVLQFHEIREVLE